MAMSRKHYREVAGIINMELKNAEAFVNDDEIGTAQYVLDNVAKSLAAMFQIDNSNFNRAQFLEACGIEGH